MARPWPPAPTITDVIGRPSARARPRRVPSRDGGAAPRGRGRRRNSGASTPSRLRAAADVLCLCRIAGAHAKGAIRRLRRRSRHRARGRRCAGRRERLGSGRGQRSRDAGGPGLFWMLAAGSWRSAIARRWCSRRSCAAPARPSAGRATTCRSTATSCARSTPTSRAALLSRRRGRRDCASRYARRLLGGRRRRGRARRRPPPPSRAVLSAPRRVGGCSPSRPAAVGLYRRLGAPDGRTSRWRPRLRPRRAARADRAEPGRGRGRAAAAQATRRRRRRRRPRRILDLIGRLRSASWRAVPTTSRASGCWRAAEAALGNWPGAARGAGAAGRPARRPAAGGGPGRSRRAHDPSPRTAMSRPRPRRR